MDFPWPVHPAAEMFRLLGDSELRELADDIRIHGLLEPIWLYNDPRLGLTLLDGRNRYCACMIAGVEPRTQRYRGDNPIDFVWSENVHRRHLTVGEKAAANDARLALHETQAKSKQAEAGQQFGRGHAGSTEKLGADLPQANTPHKPQRAPRARDHAAKEAGISGRAMAQWKRVRDKAPDLAEKVKNGELALDRAERIVRDREAEQKRIEQARAEAAAQPAPTLVDVRHGDFREVLADLRDVDAIITDPPYPGEFIPLLGDLAAWADKVLTPDGVLAVLMGQTYLPEVYRLLDGHRPYRWTACYLTPGNGYASMARRVQSNWKPLIVYGAGPRFADIIRSEGDVGAKSRHKWGQDYSAFHTIIERLTTRGQTIADPFAGSGTTLLAGHALGRHVIGCDIDPEAVATARERVA